MEKDSLMVCTHESNIWYDQNGVSFIGPGKDDVVQIQSMKMQNEKLYLNLYEYGSTQWFNSKWFIPTQSPIDMPAELFSHAPETCEA